MAVFSTASGHNPPMWHAYLKKEAESTFEFTRRPWVSKDNPMGQPRADWENTLGAVEQWIRSNAHAGVFVRPAGNFDGIEYRTMSGVKVTINAYGWVMQSYMNAYHIDLELVTKGDVEHTLNIIAESVKAMASQCVAMHVRWMHKVAMKRHKRGLSVLDWESKTDNPRHGRRLPR